MHFNTLFDKIREISFTVQPTNGMKVTYMNVHPIHYLKLWTLWTKPPKCSILFLSTH